MSAYADGDPSGLGRAKPTNADRRHPQVTTPTPAVAWAPPVDLPHWKGYACTRRTELTCADPVQRELHRLSV